MDRVRRTRARRDARSSRCGGTATSGIERGEPGDILPDDERMDVVRALVRVDGLEVQHVPAALILVRDPVRAEDVARIASDVSRHRDARALRERDLRRLERVRFLELAEPPAQELRL